MKRYLAGGAGSERGWWPVLLLLLLAVLIPTACVLWFMGEAMENQGLAARQKLADAYRAQLGLLRERFQSFWEARAAALDETPGTAHSAAAFARCIRLGHADSAICTGDKGELLYPAPPSAPGPDPIAGQQDWTRAAMLESAGNMSAAAEVYAAVAARTKDPNVAARALQAQGRCLVQGGKKDAAIEVVRDAFKPPALVRAIDLQGRLIAADAELMALHLMKNSRDSRFSAIAQRLAARLNDYENSALPASQRLFLMKEMLALGPRNFPLFEAERLAAAYLEAEHKPAAKPGLHLSAVPDVWTLASGAGRIIGLLRTGTVLRQMENFSGEQALPAGLRVVALPPGASLPQDAAVPSIPAGAQFPGWHLTLTAAGTQLADESARKQAIAYVWIGLLVIACTAMIAILIAQAIRRQLRVARMKTDLVATVSHELKTPLSSMRLLVDTLLDESRFDPVKTREYLELVARENLRLSRVIDNFLAFSRMERNKHAFEFAEVRPADLVHSAAYAVHERFATADCRFDVRVAPGLPPVRADESSLVTVLVNLLDNAWKYSGNEKRIALRAYAENEHLCFEVEDNGIGLSPRDAKKIFRKFYQVDRRLSRSVGGCGLGLSIVEFIVNAHGGRIVVKSQQGQGSTFTVMLPCTRVPEVTAAR